MSEPVTTQQEKIAVRREMRWTNGRTAYMTCTCGKGRGLPAYEGNQTCPICGSRWSETGWRLK